MKFTSNHSAKFNKNGAGCLVLFSLPFAGVGVLMTYLTASTLLYWIDVQRWEEVPCEIVAAELKTNRGSDSTTYEATARYRYEWQGAEYESDRVAIHSGSDNIGSFQTQKGRELERLHEAGEPFRCFVNPDDPQQAILYRDARIGMLAFKGMFGLVFGSVGFGLLAGGIWSTRNQKRRAAFAQEHPDEPWLWRDDWAQGVVRDTPWTTVVVSGVIAVIWNAVSWGAGLSIFFSEEELPVWAMAVMAAFPLVGVGLIGWAVYAALQAVRWGTGEFELATIPGVIGGRLAGVVHAPRRLEPADGFLATLTCYETRTRSTNKGTESYQAPLWQTDRLIGRSLFTGRDDKTAIPISFTIPYSKRSTSDSQGISWKLLVTAQVPGVDYRAEFEVPVFKTSESSPTAVADDDVMADFVKPQSLHAVLSRNHARLITETPTQLQIVLPMARNLGLALPVTGFAVIWSGVSVGLLLAEAPLLFRIVFPGSAVLVLIGALWLWFERVKIAVDSFKVDVQGGWFGLGKLQRTPLDEIKAVIVEPSGTTSGATVYQRVALETKSLGNRTVMSGFARYSDAAEVAEAIRGVLGLAKSPKPSPSQSQLDLEIDLSKSKDDNGDGWPR